MEAMFSFRCPYWPAGPGHMPALAPEECCFGSMPSPAHPFAFYLCPRNEAILSSKDSVSGKTPLLPQLRLMGPHKPPLFEYSSWFRKMASQLHRGKKRLSDAGAVPYKFPFPGERSRVIHIDSSTILLRRRSSFQEMQIGRRGSVP